MSDDSSLLFVYGTLRRGQQRHDLLEELGAEYLGQGIVVGELLDLGAYPGALKGGPQSSMRVVGELYRLADASSALKVLDDYEDAGGGAAALYRREVDPIVRSDGERVSAWVYWLNESPPGARRIESGDYATRRAR